MARNSTRSSQDETGKRLIKAGRMLVETGTPIEDLRLVDVVQLASFDQPVTIGAAYPRFGSQDEFRLEVLRSVLADQPRYRERALEKLARHLLGLPPDGEIDLEEAPDPSPRRMTPPDVADMVEDIAEDQQAHMGDDTEVPLRLYAFYRLAIADDESSRELREQIRAYDERVSSEWSNTLKTICEDLDVHPRGDLSYEEFEIALGCLLTGLTIKRQTAALPDGIYSRLIMALAIGFFAPRDEQSFETIRDAFVQNMAENAYDMIPSQERVLSRLREESERERPEEPADSPEQVIPLAVQRALQRYRD